MAKLLPGLFSALQQFNNSTMQQCNNATLQHCSTAAMHPSNQPLLQQIMHMNHTYIFTFIFHYYLCNLIAAH